ncbi:tyrosine-type recombinase/integrase [Longibaculum muris]|uniref:tyrosine-type recombinase/integrase n=1 Tax=Longibaculum muris TaxID=1796628 RepID=UPI003AB7F2A7
MAIYKNDKGLWSIRYKYKDNNGVWQQKMAYSGKSGFIRKKDAVEKEKEIIQEVQTSLLKSLDKNHKTFKEVMDEALLECKFYMKETSIKTTLQALNHAKSLFDYPIDEITSQQLRQIMVDLIKKDLSVGTMDKIYYKINLIFKYALENDYINVNPLSKVKRVKRPDQLEDNVFNVWKLSQFQEYIQNVHDPMYYTLFSLLYYLGLRRGEALGLQWKHVDLTNGTVHVKQTLSNVHSIKNPVLTPPKSKNSIRLIHMPKILLKIMKEWHKYESTKYYFNENAFVFGNVCPLARNTVYNQFRRHLRIGTKGYGYTNKESLIGKLEVDEIVLLKGKVYYNENKLGGYQEFNIHVQIIDIVDNYNELNYVVAIALPYLRMHDLRHPYVKLTTKKFATFFENFRATA